MQTQRFTRRSFLKSVGLASVGLAMSSCIAPTAAPSGTGMGTPAPEQATIRVLFHSDRFLDYLNAYSDRFRATHAGVTVDVQIAPATEFPQKILTSIAAGAPPDLFRTVNVENFAQFFHNDIMLPLDDYIERDHYDEYLAKFLPGSIETGQLGGKQYSIPWGAHPSSLYLFYNKTALSAKGFTLDNPDWTWAEYSEIAQTMADPENDVFGTWIRANFEGFMVGTRSMGGDLIDDTGTKSLLATDEARRFWQLIYDMINVYDAAPQPTDVTDWRSPFAAGKIMMANDNGYRESFLRGMAMEFEFDVFVIPNEGSLPRGGLICNFLPIAAASKHPDLAWEWYKGFLTTEESTKRSVETNTVPLPTEAVLLADVVSPYYEFYVRQWIDNPPLPAPTAANGRSSEVFSTLQSSMEAAWLKSEPLETVITRVDGEVQAILDREPA